MYQPKTISGKEMVPEGAYPVYGANGVIGRYDKFNHEDPQLLITCRGATCGSVNTSEPRSWITGNAMVVRPKDSNINIRFLEYLFRGGIDIYKAITGAAQPQITRTNLEKLTFSYPPLDEQKRIVAILDQAFSSIAIAKANTEKNLANARDVFERYLDTAFSGDHTKWLPRKLGDQSMLQIIDGDRGANYPKKTDFTNEGHCVFLSTKNVRPDGFRFDDIVFIDESKDQSLRNGKLRRRDVILTTRGTIGNIALYGDDVEYNNIRINSGMLIFRPNEDIILSDFLFEIFRSKIMKSQINEFVTGAAQPQLPIKTLINFTIPVPISVDDQTAIVSRLRELNHETRQLEQLSRSKLTALDDLKQSLLHAAFTGQLTAAEPVAA